MKLSVPQKILDFESTQFSATSDISDFLTPS